MNSTRVQVICYEAGSTDGTLESISDPYDRQDAAEKIEFETEKRNRRVAYLCRYYGGTKGTLASIADANMREQCRLAIADDDANDLRDDEFDLRQARRRSAREQRQKQAFEQADGRQERIAQRSNKRSTRLRKLFG